ncbi:MULTISPECIES: hypothetical protein [unclassified Acinetobacter]|uniref:hypothetical protein n=1 Tax=unclassified Acinetobacter TaxID=196816 RepID=UPI0035B7817A
MTDYRIATSADIDGIMALQSLYHVDSISEKDKANGFVTTLFSKEQLSDLIDNPDNALVIALNEQNVVVGYAMNADWHYWSQWTFFQHMIADLPNVQLDGIQATLDNSFQYGPVCIHTDYRGGDVLKNLFDRSCQHMAKRFLLLLTFINHKNPRSHHAHVNKLGLTVIKNFEFNSNQYYYLGYNIAEL